MIIGLSLIFALLLLLIIMAGEQESIETSIHKLEEMKQADSIMILDRFDQELFSYHGLEVKSRISTLLTMSTFEEQYQKRIDRVIDALYVTITFYNGDNTLGAYKIYEVDDISSLGGIAEKIMIIHQKPYLVEFDNRYWTLGDSINIGK